MRNKIYIIITVLVILFAQTTSVVAAADPVPKITAKAAVVIDAETGDVLYQKNSNEKREPASTTKIMTALLALENLELDKVVTVSGKIDNMGNRLNLEKGEMITVEDLLYGLIIHSANDAANVLATEVSGSQEAFAELMTKRAKECGAKNTLFLNPNGLNWAWQPGHQTTAYDLAVIAKEAMKNEDFQKIASTVNYTIGATNKSGPRKIKSTNLCLWDKKSKIKVNGQTTTPYFEKATGIKTGLTSTAGACFVGGADYNGTKLISVVLNSGTLIRFAETRELWDYCIREFYETHNFAKKGQKLEKVRVYRGAIRSVDTVAENDVAATVLAGKTTKNITTKFIPKKVTAPINKGENMGIFEVYNGNTKVSSTRAISAEAVEKGGPLSYIGISDVMAIAIYIFVGLLMVTLILFRVTSGAGRRKRKVARRAKRR